MQFMHANYFYIKGHRNLQQIIIHYVHLSCSDSLDTNIFYLDISEHPKYFNCFRSHGYCKTSFPVF